MLTTSFLTQLSLNTVRQVFYFILKHPAELSLIHPAELSLALSFLLIHPAELSLAVSFLLIHPAELLLNLIPTQTSTKFTLSLR